VVIFSFAVAATVRW